MARSRLVLHPLFAHARTRMLFVVFAALSSALAVVCWRAMHAAAQAANISPFDPRFDSNPVLQFTFSFWVWLMFCLASTCLATAYASYRVLGPMHRLEIWLHALADGRPAGPFRVRGRDEMSYVAQLINAILAKTSRRA